MAEPTAPMSEMTPPEETVARARAIARDLGARLFISPSDLGLYDELEAFLARDAAAARSALAVLDDLTPAQLRGRLAALGVSVPPADRQTEHEEERAAPRATVDEEEYVSPWPVPDAEHERQDPAASPPADDVEDDSWLREWDSAALLGGVEP